MNRLTCNSNLCKRLTGWHPKIRYNNRIKKILNGQRKLEINFSKLNKILADGNKWILKSQFRCDIKNRGGYYAWINTRTKNYSQYIQNNEVTVC